MTKIGIELGIRAPYETIRDAALISQRSKKVCYFFVPETHPKFIGVDAFGVIKKLSKEGLDIKLGTGVVNVFSRSKKEILSLAGSIYQDSNENFILGLGTSTPHIVENMYKMRFEKPLTRLVSYTNYLKNYYKGPIYWGAVGNKAIRLAAKYASGVMFFLKKENEIIQSQSLIRSELDSLGEEKDFEIIVIRPIIIDESKEDAIKAAKISLASYFTGNKFYADPIAKSGYQKEISEIREAFSEGLSSAAPKVSEKMVNEFVTLGNVDECARNFKEFTKRVRAGCVVAGFMSVSPKVDRNTKFLRNLEEMITHL